MMERVGDVRREELPRAKIAAADRFAGHPSEGFHHRALVCLEFRHRLQADDPRLDEAPHPALDGVHGKILLQLRARGLTVASIDLDMWT